jgi:hypothetical protein
VNACLFYLWVLWASGQDFSDPSWQFGQRLGETVAPLLVAVAVIAALGGSGRARAPLALSALLGLLLWIPARLI